MTTNWIRHDKKLEGKTYDGQGKAADGSSLRFDQGGTKPCPICAKKEEAPRES